MNLPGFIGRGLHRHQQFAAAVLEGRRIMWLGTVLLVGVASAEPGEGARHGAQRHWDESTLLTGTRSRDAPDATLIRS